MASKEYVMFEDKKCDCGEFKLTDGFHDKVMKWTSQKISGIKIVPKEEIDLHRIVKRLKGTRNWHPLLRLLRENEAV